MVCISNTKGNSCYSHYEHNSKVGRPKKVKKLYPHRSNIEVEWHLHILKFLFHEDSLRRTYENLRYNNLYMLIFKLL